MTKEENDTVVLGTVYERLMDHPDFKVFWSKIQEMKSVGQAKVMNDGYDDAAVRRGFENRGRIKMIDHIANHLYLTVEEKARIILNQEKANA